VIDDDDAALLAEIRQGSQRAFNTLIDRRQQAVRGFLRRMLGSAADADDIAQETFLAAWRSARHFRGDCSVRSWLCAIAWREAKMAQRSAARRWARDGAWQADAETVDESSAEDRLAVRQAMLTLPPEQRAAVALCLGEGFSHSEASAALGLPLGTIKSHVNRGKSRLLEALSEEGGGR
jgi:RNA polymerase sigma-70 factor (ECF subfamily)